MNKNHSLKLPSHEWSIILLFCLILLSLAGFALKGTKSRSPLLISFTEPVKVKKNERALKIEKPNKTKALEKGEALEKTKQMTSSEQKNIIEVSVIGEVSKPGLYQLPLRSTMKHLLEETKPLPSADLSELNWRRWLKNGETIEIPKRHLIEITLSGAVEKPGVIKILSGFRCFEVIDQLDLLPTADTKNFRRKRSFIRDGDCVTIPVREKR